MHSLLNIFCKTDKKQHYISKQDSLKIAKDRLKKGEITKEDYKKIESLLNL